MRPRTCPKPMRVAAACAGLAFLLGACVGREQAPGVPPPTSVAAIEAADQPATDGEVEIVQGELPREGADADVLLVRALQEGETLWRFEVTIQHPDTGAKDRADGWELLLPDDSVVKPDPGATFTQDIDGPIASQPVVHRLSGIEIPTGVAQIRVRAHDSVDGFGGRELVLDMRTSAGPGYEIVHTY